MTLFDLKSDSVIHSRAVLSDDKVYRYTLGRWWDHYRPADLWLMCNPSTADHEINDPTITRCIGFSQRFGSGGFNVANAYGFRASKPATMWAAALGGTDIVGPENDYWLRMALGAVTGRVIVAWGAHPKPDRVRQVIGIVEAAGHVPLCLGITKGGQPRHPLMLRSDAQLHLWADSGKDNQ